MATLFREDFDDLPAGPLPADFSAVGEYHFAPPEGEMGPWYEPSRDYRNRSPWVVLEDEGDHVLLQPFVTNEHWPRLLVAGTEWGDCTVTVRLRPLRPDGFAGFCFRYRTGRSHYRIGFDGGGALKLLKIDHEQREVLAEAETDYSCEDFTELSVELSGDRITASVAGSEALRAEDATFAAGRVALTSMIPCIYGSVEVTAPEEVAAAHLRTREKEARELDELREKYPRPVLWKWIDTKGFGTGRHIRFGHLSGGEELDFILAQSVKPLQGDYATVRCLTAMNLDGEVLWQFGEPGSGREAGMLTADVPVQIHDIDGDGHDEVICMKNFRLYVLDGATGEVKNSVPTPTGPTHEDNFGRLTGDCIITADLRGQGRPGDIIIKNRYRQIWALDGDLKVMWERSFPDWQTGHFAQPYDFDGDGRDEIFIGYCLLGPDGEMRWSQDWEDHTDEIAIGPFDDERTGVQIALASGDAGFSILAPDGTVLHREMLGHAQRLSAAKFREDLPGLQFYVVTYWGVAGIISFHNRKGKRLFEMEPTALGNVLNPVNWTGGGEELALLTGSVEHGGMLDGHGRRVVVFPDDGHPELCAEAIDLAGDGRDEVVLWDAERLWVYTQDRPFEGKRMYHPVRYPHRNASNYRAEISLPAWQEVDE